MHEEKFSQRISQQASLLFNEFRAGEDGRTERTTALLRLSLEKAALTLGTGQVTDERFREAASLAGAETLELLRPAWSGFEVIRSTETGRQGQTISRSDSLEGDWSGVPLAHGARFQAITSSGEGERMTVFRGFYADFTHPYILSLSMHIPELTPQGIIDAVKMFNPQVLEVGIWMTGSGSTPSVLQYGTSYYTADARGRELQQLVSVQGLQSQQTVMFGKSVLRSWYPYSSKGGSYIISIVTDCTADERIANLHRQNQFWRTGFILILTMLGAWVIIHRYLKPLKSILHKVNEVAFGRFEQDIRSSRRDEIGELANRINHMSWSLRTYTDQLKAASNENALIKEQLESIFNNTADAIVIIGLDGKLLKVNQAFLSTFGYTEEQSLSMQISDIVEPLDWGGKEQDIVQMLSGELLPPGEEKWLNSSGEYVQVGVTLSPARNSEGEVWSMVAVARDMTSRSKMEELLRRSEKLTTVGKLAAGVAHEIRNPLTTLRGFLQLQQQSGRLNLQHNDIMLTELDRINLIVGEFLILAKPQAIKFEVKDVRFTLGDVISLLDSEGHLHNVVFHTRFPAESCFVSCEENQLKQVFINVIKNAIESMPQGGNVYFDIERENGRSVSVTVTDEGIGIEEDIIPRIGDPFFTRKESGTGLGIMVSQRIIQGHRGIMEISSKLGEGTAVKITLPLLPPQEQTQTSA